MREKEGSAMAIRQMVLQITSKRLFAGQCFGGDICHAKPYFDTIEFIYEIKYP